VTDKDGRLPMTQDQKSKTKDRRWVIALCLVAILTSGCVERRLTINTQPQGAVVVLNDQEIGVSPVTVSFNWYGDYWVRAGKDGYETLNTHRKLKAPLYDHPPLDFFAEILWPGRIVNAYEWTFDLSPKVSPTREELIETGESLRTQLQ